MTKSKKQMKNTVSDSEDELTFSESEEEQLDLQSSESGSESGSESEQEEVEPEPEPKEQKKSQAKVKLTSHDIIEELEDIHNELSKLSSTFKEETTKFNKLEKEYISKRKELEKLQQSFLKKLSKTVSSRSKPTKKRDPNTIGGFNKKTQVPTCLCTYLELDKDSQMLSRPEVVAILKTKFEEAGYVNSETKEIKVPNKLLKKFGHKKGYVFKGNRYQSFLKVIYDNFKKECVSV